MNVPSSFSRQTAHAGRQTSAHRPASVADEPAPLDCPAAREVIGEIGVILAVHLVAALAISLTLSALGIA